jgi:uncharacterized protein (DUF2252 family)
MNIKRATRQYESWLAAHTRLVPGDLALKHKYMAQGKDKGLFAFFRATFYRWAQIWPKLCPELARAPVVLAVGDLHVENFGIWRNAEERLVWGVNDVDEAYMLPYTADLVRLATSAELAVRADELDVPSRDICENLLSSYADGLRTGGDPYVLDGRHNWLHRLTTGDPRKQEQYWRKLLALPVTRDQVPESALRVLEQLLPEPNLPYHIAHREAGVGSLGRDRWTAIAPWRDGWVVREVKALVPSAWQWAAQAEPAEPLVGVLLGRAVRSPDPYVRVEQGWITRRLAPDSRRIDLNMLSNRRAERLLYAMGQETANMHLGSRSAIPAVLLDLGSRPARWLHDAVQIMIKTVIDDWEDWRHNAMGER